MPEMAVEPTSKTDAEQALGQFLAHVEARRALPLRTLAHAWRAGGGALSCGRHTVRLTGRDGTGRVFTAATLGAEPARLELAKVILLAHGVTAQGWVAWADERPELAAYGFEPGAKFPVVDLGALPDAALARLATGLRDLAVAVAPRAAA